MPSWAAKGGVYNIACPSQAGVSESAVCSMAGALNVQVQLLYETHSALRTRSKQC